ncbi:diaminopimelate epimerase [Rhodovulum sulfidophilum]|uniref:diaminopimelate epimerase n=1 Tax=Rhodovulum sulfidophilum TaxID=35806 RepID=UPI0019240039|nr:diaminopimelate epimerase [Rhodovulum sulfidophilum]MBL3562147.1 diaminopimelate epimerase [Rhodovulum sulfidophilum]
MARMDDTERLPFMKMHGLGNDFVVIDRRQGGMPLSAGLVAAIADRHRGVGFDQLAVIEPAPDADARLVFYNADGSLSATCGNATRCIARHLIDQTGRRELTLVTERGRLSARDAGEGLTSVNMGPPILDWRGVPLADDVDLDRLPIAGEPVATGMGNPHCTFFVDDAEAVDLEAFGPEHEHHPLFPERTNVQVAHLAGPDRVRMRVWERGTGLTLASGSSSCAVAVAAARRGLTGRSVTILLDGGELRIDWREDGVWMTGPTAHVFDGVFTAAFLAEVG